MLSKIFSRKALIVALIALFSAATGINLPPEVREAITVIAYETATAVDEATDAQEGN